jgi:hypothetical protein
MFVSFGCKQVSFERGEVEMKRTERILGQEDKERKLRREGKGSKRVLMHDSISW